jgi:hypothetical protein
MQAYWTISCCYYWWKDLPIIPIYINFSSTYSLDMIIYNSSDERNKELVGKGDFLEFIVCSSLDNSKDNSYLPHFQV